MLREGQRVCRMTTDELGTVVEADGKIKVKWDGGRTSYFRRDQVAERAPQPKSAPRSMKANQHPQLVGRAPCGALSNERGVPVVRAKNDDPAKYFYRFWVRQRPGQGKPSAHLMHIRIP